MSVEIKSKIYTSFYSKILNRHKRPNDIYIRVSKGLFFPKKGVDGKSIMSMIDVNLGNELGMFENTLAEYEERVGGSDYKDVIAELAETVSAKNALDEMTDKEIGEAEDEIKILLDMKAAVEKKTVDERKKFYSELSQNEKDNLAVYGFEESTLENIADWEPCPTFYFFILCFEDLETKYTEKDEKKNPDCKAGTFKTCHRTVIAKILNERYGLGITEL